jgi:hypothetical protein
MMYAKAIALTTIPFVVTMFSAYLIGSFINASWSPEMWTMDLRILMSIFGMCFGYAMYLKLSFERLV